MTAGQLPPVQIIARLTAQGLTDKQIARRYGVSVSLLEKSRARRGGSQLDRADFTSLAELAAELGVARMTLRSACRTGLIAHTRHGRLYGFTAEQARIVRLQYRPDLAPPGVTIADKSRAALNAVLGECVRQRTEAGVKKYGQTLDDNDQPGRAKAIHLIQELLDGVAYAYWDDDADTARALARLADRKQRQYGLSAKEIMQGGKR